MKNASSDETRTGPATYNDVKCEYPPS